MILAVLALASCDDGKDVKIDSTPIPTIEDYKTKSQPLNFRKSMLKQIEIGQLTKFEGRISPKK